jgi:hypothetical protein
MSRILKFTGAFVITLLLVATGFAQAIKGTVTDSIGKPVAFANISLKNSNSLIIAYAISNTNGEYKLNIPAGKTATGLLAEVSCIGFKKQSKSVGDLSAPVNFVLSRNVTQLNTVNIKFNGPRLRVHGDTIGYKVSDFSNPQDRVIGDVIKKLPGISVAADGKISYNGKSISNLYIGGDNLLDDKYNIATNTIPNGVVDQVQVIENHQPIKMMQNKVSSDDVALNLTIKKDAKLQVVGQETVGAGVPGNYDENLNAMMFKYKYKAINYLKGNNTGNDVQNDLVSHNLSDYMKKLDNDKPATLLSLGSVSTPDLQENRYLFNQSAILNLNNLVNLKKGQQLKVNLHYLHDMQRQDYTQQTQLFLPNDTIKYNESQRNKFRPDILHSQFTLNINKDKYYLNDALIMDYSHQTSWSNLSTNGTAVNQVFKDNSLDFSNEMNLINSLKTNNIFEVYSYINHISEPENRLITPGYNPQVFNNGKPYPALVQTANVPAWFTNNYIAYKIPAGITQSYKAGFLWQSQKLQSALSVFQTNNSVNLASDSALNSLNWNRKKLYTEAAYDYNGDIFKINLTVPVSLQQIQYADSLYHLDKSLSRVYINPKLRIKYQLSAENYFSFFYNYVNNIGNIQDVYRGNILKDYRTLYANNADLTENKGQKALLGFNYRKAISLFFFSVNTSFNHIDANTITSSVITNSIQQRIVLPYRNSIDSWSVNGYISEYSFALRTTFSAGAQLQSSRSTQIQNNILLPYQTLSTRYNAGADVKISDALTASYKANLGLTSSHSPASTSSQNISQLVQQAELNYNPANDLFFKLSGDHYFTRQQSNELKYFFADASAKFRFEKLKTEVELSALNLMNVKNYNSINLTANMLTASSFTLPGRIVMVKMIFNI